MEIAGLGVGIAGLSGLFSACLDVVERIDSYKSFDVDSRAIISQFDADKLLFKQWGKAVGFDGESLGNSHHENLDDAETLLAVRKTFAVIQDIITDFVEEPSSQRNGSDSMSSVRPPNDSRRIRLQKFQGVPSYKTKLEWTLRHKTRFLVLSQQFGSLVGSLRALVPPESSRPADLMAGQTSRGILSPSDSMGVDNALLHLDPQRILLDIEKQIKRKHLLAILSLEAHIYRRYKERAKYLALRLFYQRHVRRFYSKETP